MALNIERWDQWFWLFSILFVLAIYLLGLEEGWALILLAPVVLILKNRFLKKQISWKPEYSVGVAILDADHKKFLELLQEMFRNMGGLRNKAAAARVLEELTRYAETHFAREEALMRKHDFPGLEAHVREHDEMRRKVEAFRRSFKEDNANVSSKLLRYLQEWLVNHIITTDKQYMEFLNGKGER